MTIQITGIPKEKKAERRAYITRISSYRYGAQNRDLCFELTNEQCVSLFLGNCFYCGEIPSTGKRTKQFSEVTMNGIDRLDSKKGYVLENIVSACGLCNTKKKAVNHQQFLGLIEQIYKNRLLKGAESAS